MPFAVHLAWLILVPHTRTQRPSPSTCCCARTKFRKPHMNSPRRPPCEGSLAHADALHGITSRMSTAQYSRNISGIFPLHFSSSSHERESHGTSTNRFMIPSECDVVSASVRYTYDVCVTRLRHVKWMHVATVKANPRHLSSIPLQLTAKNTAKWEEEQPKRICCDPKSSTKLFSFLPPHFNLC
jgi:hypothetical protein